jgi:hypothetical protein
MSTNYCDKCSEARVLLTAFNRILDFVQVEDEYAEHISAQDIIDRLDDIMRERRAVNDKHDCDERPTRCLDCHGRGTTLEGWTCNTCEGAGWFEDGVPIRLPEWYEPPTTREREE